MNTPRLSKRAAFTLTEALVVVALVAVLLLLGAGALGTARSRAADLKCMSYLKIVGQTLLQMSIDQNGELGTHYSGAYIPNSPIRRYGYPWTYQLVISKRLSAREMLDYRCPLRKADPDSYTSEHYGFMLHDPEGEILSDGQGKAYRIRVRTHPRPSASILLADSRGVGTDRQAYRIFPLPANRSLIEPRHRSRAHLFFLDGHLEAADAGRLQTLGIGYIYDSDADEIKHLNAP
ncbi:MAG TPA: hypothetical protein VNQ90_15940 [Chthoniobacteraceae bacterium]|nr:hypothetical protein [Chthoniobacteraceae bacterium]